MVRDRYRKYSKSAKKLVIDEENQCLSLTWLQKYVKRAASINLKKQGFKLLLWTAALPDQDISGHETTVFLQENWSD